MAWYQIDIQPDGDTWLVTSPHFEELATYGSDQEEACINARSAIEEAIAGRIADGEEIPTPLPDMGKKGHFIELPAMVLLKSSLYMVMRSQGKTRADLMRDLHWHREQVDRLFRLDHQSKLDNIEDAFRALGAPLRLDVPFPVAA